MHRGHWTLLGISLFCALLILAIAFFMGESKYRDTMQFLVIAIWWIPFSYYLARQNEFRCGRKRGCPTPLEDT